MDFAITIKSYDISDEIRAHAACHRDSTSLVASLMMTGCLLALGNHVRVTGLQQRRCSVFSLCCLAVSQTGGAAG